MPKEYVSLNAFRALAAFWVLAAHCSIWGGWRTPFIPEPKLAVNLFMVLSGFLMVHVSNSRWDEEPLNRLRNFNRFVTRRFFRIAPAYYLSLLLAAIFSSYFLGGYQVLYDNSPIAFSDVLNPRNFSFDYLNIIAHISFLFGLHPTLSFSTYLPDWSLSLEMQFYVAFPLIYIAFRKIGPASASVPLWISCFLATYLLRGHAQYTEPSLIVFKLKFFLSGMMLWYSLNDRGHLYRKYLYFVISIAMSADRSQMGFVCPVLVASMYALSAAENSGFSVRFLRSRVITFCSDVSYGVYLFHGFFISASGLLIGSNPTLLGLNPIQRSLLIFAITLPGSYLAAALVHRLVELPGISLGQRILRRKRVGADALA